MSNTLVQPKFFHFSQNNSGGHFHADESVAHHVIIEAVDALHANARAESIGLYFDGCDKDIDCSCCGDRWYAKWNGDVGDAGPMIYDKRPEEYCDIFTKSGDPYCHVYFLDGLKKTYRKP